jgi:two-component system response regulator RpaA
MTEKAKEVYTTGEVAKLLKVTTPTVGRWFDSGRLRGYRVGIGKGARRMVPLAEFKRFIAEYGLPNVLEGEQ